MKRFAALLLGVIAAAPLLAQAPPADVVTVGTIPVASAGSTVDVPVFIRDTSGTPLGIDQPFGSRIQSYSLTVNYAPTSAVQSITFTRGGVTQPLTPAFESSPATTGQISLIDVFDESTNLIPFTSNAALPGQQVGTLHVTISPAATLGTVINLTLDSTLTQLSNQAGTTSETVALNTLVLVPGSIVVTTSVPALSTWALAALAIALAGIGIVLVRR
jgi:IPTL-CTERM motif